jgi:hypothetical protein
VRFPFPLLLGLFFRQKSDVFLVFFDDIGLCKTIFLAEMASRNYSVVKICISEIIYKELDSNRGFYPCQVYPLFGFSQNPGAVKLEDCSVVNVCLSAKPACFWQRVGLYRV